jgi:hypothetical protein
MRRSFLTLLHNREHMTGPHFGSLVSLIHTLGSVIERHQARPRAVVQHQFGDSLLHLLAAVRIRA